MPNDIELTFMRRAFDLAAKSRGQTRPNPPVGAVVVKDGKIIGEGRHKFCGGDHAEVAALKSCISDSAEGATVYCTLEPCSKPGRVGACCDALIAAKVRRVAWACADPNPKNANRAAQVLGGAGIETECWQTGEDKSHRECAQKIWDETLAPFAKHVLTGLPFVIVKLAMSLDGKICDDFGKSQWISCKESLQETAKWREIVDVVLVGAETVRKDNPSLLCHTKKNDNLWRAVVSRSGDLPKDAQIFTDEAKDRTLVYSDPAEAIRDIGARGFSSVLCEGGLSIARTLAESGLVDKWHTILCPMVIGSLPLSEARHFKPAIPMFNGNDIFSTSEKMI